MTLIDSTVWIDFFNNVKSVKTNQLNELLTNEIVCIADIVLLEVLQGIRNDKQYFEVEKLFINLKIFNVLNTEIAIKSAQNYRFLKVKALRSEKQLIALLQHFALKTS